MPQPGESFPAQFALGILQLKQQREQAKAQLAEMRNARAAQNFLAKERQDLIERQQNQQAALHGQSIASQDYRAQLQADVQKEASLARIKMETDRLALERDQTVARSITDFGRTGTAFIPSYAAAKVP